MPSPTPPTTLTSDLRRLGLRRTADDLNDIIARATRQHWSPTVLLEHIVTAELEERRRRSIERRLTAARLGRFKPIADWDWDWPTALDRPALERRLRHYARPALLAIDEIGYLAYDAHAADLLFQIVSRRYEQRPLLMTTNLAFKHWDTIFPNASCAVALIDRLTHHAEIVVIEGDSYSGGLEMTAQPLLQLGTVVLDPAPDGRVVRFQAALAEPLFAIAERKRVPQVPAHSAQNQLGLGLSPREDCRSNGLLHHLFRLPVAGHVKARNSGQASSAVTAVSVGGGYIRMAAPSQSRYTAAARSAPRSSLRFSESSACPKPSSIVCDE